MIAARDPAQPCRVLILAPGLAAREALRWALESEPDLTVVGEVADGQEALAGVVSLAPDVVLLDVARSGTDAIGLTQAIKATPNPPAAILLATAGNPGTRRRYAQAGGDGLVEKGAGWPALIREIRQAMARRAPA